MRPDHEGVEFPRSRLDLDLSAVPCGVSPSAVHRKLASSASSSRELYASSRVPTTCDLPLVRPSSLAATQAPRSASRAVSSLIAAPLAASTAPRGSPPRVLFRPRRFARPRRFTPPPALRACFIPLPRPGFALQGFDPSPRSRTGFPRPIHALVPLNEPRLRFDPRQHNPPSTSGPCSPRRVRCPTRPVKASLSPYPSWASSSSGFSLPAS
jgi:hypothetical protein